MNEESKNDIIADIHRALQESLKMGIQDDCFAMIRLPVSISNFTSFARVCERISPNCVTTQTGDFVFIMHAPK